MMVTCEIITPGTSYLHEPSNSLVVVTRDDEDKNVFYVTTLINRSCPNLSFRTHRIKGSFQEGLLDHEISPYVDKWEYRKVNPDWKKV